MNIYLLKTPVYITDEFGPGGAFLIILLGVAIIFIARLMAGSNNAYVSAFGEEFIFKIGIGLSLSGVIAFIISLLQ